MTHMLVEHVRSQKPCDFSAHIDALSIDEACKCVCRSLHRKTCPRRWTWSRHVVEGSIIHVSIYILVCGCNTDISRMSTHGTDHMPIRQSASHATPLDPQTPAAQSRIQGFGSSEGGGGGGNGNEYRGGATLNPPSSASNTFSASSASERFSGTSGSAVPSYGPSSSSRGGSSASAASGFSNGSGSVMPSRMVGFGSDSSYRPGQQATAGGGRGGVTGTGPGIGVGEMMSSLGSNVNSFIRSQFNAEVRGCRSVDC